MVPMSLSPVNLAPRMEFQKSECPKWSGLAIIKRKDSLRALPGEVGIGLILHTTPNQPFVQLPKTQASIIFYDLQRHTTLKAWEVALVKSALVDGLIGELPDTPFFADTGPTDAKDSVFLTI